MIDRRPKEDDLTMAQRPMDLSSLFASRGPDSTPTSSPKRPSSTLEDCLEFVQDALGYKFRNEELLRSALFGRHYGVFSINPDGDNPFIHARGDSLLRLATWGFLYGSNPFTRRSTPEHCFDKAYDNETRLKFADLAGVRVTLEATSPESRQGRFFEQDNLGAFTALLEAIYLDAGVGDGYSQKGFQAVCDAYCRIATKVLNPKPESESIPQVTKQQMARHGAKIEELETLFQHKFTTHDYIAPLFLSKRWSKDTIEILASLGALVGQIAFFDLWSKGHPTFGTADKERAYIDYGAFAHPCNWKLDISDALKRSLRMQRSKDMRWLPIGAVFGAIYLEAGFQAATISCNSTMLDHYLEVTKDSSK